MKSIVNSVLVLFCSVYLTTAVAQNSAESEEAFMDMGFGIFVHWSFDSQLGSVISHSMVGASDDYLDRYINELPKTFYPSKFDPDEWARQFKIAGAEYVVFTTKHHNGFCMWDTKTTAFNIMNTPYGQDITGLLVESLRKYGLKVGFYYSPEDFYFLHNQGTLITRTQEKSQVTDNPELLAYSKLQLDELLTNYGPIDLLFFDAFETAPLVSYVHSLDPDIVVTRGEMETPEQRVPDGPMPGPWEANMTMGTQWQYKPTNETYKSGTEIIERLIEIRAKGGNFLLNVGPKPNGEIPIEQEQRLQELGLWMFVNGEAIKGVRPLDAKIKEGYTWFTQDEEENAVYVFITGQKDWGKGERRSFLMETLRAKPSSTISVLGQNDLVVEYWKNNTPDSRIIQHENLLEISISRAQRLYNDRTWPNPIVVKLTDVEVVKQQQD